MSEASKPGFKITSGKGFHITFANGYTVSVQFGPGNYCDNYGMRVGSEGQQAGEKGSSTAECAVWGSDNEFVERFDGQFVSNRSTPAEVLELLNWAASQPSQPSQVAA